MRLFEVSKFVEAPGSCGFAAFFGVAAFDAFGSFAFGDFLLFGFPAFVFAVASCVLIVFSFVLSASDDTFITPVRKEGEAKDRESRRLKKRTG